MHAFMTITRQPQLKFLVGKLTVQSPNSSSFSNCNVIVIVIVTIPIIHSFRTGGYDVYLLIRETANGTTPHLTVEGNLNLGDLGTVLH